MKKHQKIKTNKLCALTAILMILAYVAPLTVYAAEQASGQGESVDTGTYIGIPGVPDDTVQYNRTEITPVAQTEQVAAGEPALFQYRNMTMLMNCTRKCDVVVTVDPTVKPQLFGLSIDPNQTMTLTMNVSGSPLESALVMQQTLDCYYGIEPNATIQLKAQLRLYINQTELSQQLNREVDTSRLTWMYWNRTRAEWEPVESYMDQNGYLVCNTDHFSTWTVAEIGPEEATQYVVNIVFFFVVIIIAICIISVVVFKLRS